MFSGDKNKKSGCQSRKLKKKKELEIKKGSQTIDACLKKYKSRLLPLEESQTEEVGDVGLVTNTDDNSWHELHQNQAEPSNSSVHGRLFIIKTSPMPRFICSVTQLIKLVYDTLILFYS